MEIQINFSVSAGLSSSILPIGTEETELYDYYTRLDGDEGRLDMPMMSSSSQSSTVSSISDIENYPQPPYYGADTRVSSFAIQHLTNHKHCTQGVLKIDSESRSLELDEVELRDIMWDTAMSSWKVLSIRSGGDMELIGGVNGKPLSLKRSRGRRASQIIDGSPEDYYAAFEGWKRHATEKEAIILVEMSKGNPPVCAVWEDMAEGKSLNPTRWKSLGPGGRDIYEFLPQNSERDVLGTQTGQFTKVRSVYLGFDARTCARDMVTVWRSDELLDFHLDSGRYDGQDSLEYRQNSAHTQGASYQKIQEEEHPGDYPTNQDVDDEQYILSTEEWEDLDNWSHSNESRINYLGGDGTSDEKSEQSEGESSEEILYRPSWMTEALKLSEDDVLKLPVYEEATGEGLRVVYITKDPHNGDRVPLVDYVGEFDQRYPHVLKHIQDCQKQSELEVETLTVECPQLGVKELKMRLYWAYRNAEEKKDELAREGKLADWSPKAFIPSKEKDLSSKLKTVVVGVNGKLFIDGSADDPESQGLSKDISSSKEIRNLDKLKGFEFSPKPSKQKEIRSRGQPLALTQLGNIAFGDVVIQLSTEPKQKKMDEVSLTDTILGQYPSENLAPQIPSLLDSTRLLRKPDCHHTNTIFEKWSSTVQGHYIVICVENSIVFLQIDDTVLSYPPNTPPHNHTPYPLLDPQSNSNGDVPLLFRILPTEPTISKSLRSAFTSVYDMNAPIAYHAASSRSSSLADTPMLIPSDLKPREKPWLDKALQRQPEDTAPTIHFDSSFDDELIRSPEFRHSNFKKFTNSPLYMPHCFPHKIPAFPGYMYQLADYEKYGKHGVPGAYEVSDHTKEETNEDVAERLQRMKQWEAGDTSLSSNVPGNSTKRFLFEGDGTCSSEEYSEPEYIADSSLDNSTFHDSSLEFGSQELRVTKNHAVAKFLRRGRSASMTQLEILGKEKAIWLNSDLLKTTVQNMGISSQDTSNDSSFGSRLRDEESPITDNSNENNSAIVCSTKQNVNPPQSDELKINGPFKIFDSNSMDYPCDSPWSDYLVETEDTKPPKLDTNINPRTTKLTSEELEFGVVDTKCLAGIDDDMREMKHAIKETNHNVKEMKHILKDLNDFMNEIKHHIMGMKPEAPIPTFYHPEPDENCQVESLDKNQPGCTNMEEQNLCNTILNLVIPNADPTSVELDIRKSWLIRKRGTSSKHSSNLNMLLDSRRLIRLNRWNSGVLTFDHLTQLILTSKIKATSTILETILSGEILCNRLVYLEIGQTVDDIPPKVLDIDDNLICRLAKRCPGLVGIGLHGAPGLTDRSIETILDWCKFICGILLTGHPAFPGKITHKVIEVLEKCRVACNLRELVLLNQPQVDVDVAQRLLDEHAPNLVLTTGTYVSRTIHKARYNEYHDGCLETFQGGDSRRWMLITDFLNDEEIDNLRQKEIAMTSVSKSKYDVPRIFKVEKCMGGCQFPLDEEQLDALHNINGW